MNFAVLGAGIWGGLFWSKGEIQPVLVVAAMGAALGAIYLGSKYLIENFANRR